MKILILTPWYAPFIHPRAHRWTVLAEHWAGEGHEVQVLTARNRNHPVEETINGVRICRCGYDSLKEWVYNRFSIRQARGRVGNPPRAAGFGERLLNAVYRNIWKNLFFPDDACLWYFPAKRQLGAMLQKENYDVLISVSLPFTTHLIGYTVLKNMPDRPRWIADIGDPFAFQALAPNNRLFYGKLNRWWEQRILQAADACTVTTMATLQLYRKKLGATAVRNMRVIPPLLKTSFLLQKEIKRTTRRLKIGYFGALYAPTRTPDACLAWLSGLKSLAPDWYACLEVHFYGEIFPEFYDQLKAESAIHLHGLRSREECWQAMQEMDILLNIGNTTDFQLPSKAVEYLAAGKPVLHFSYVSGDPFSVFFAQILPDSHFFILNTSGNTFDDRRLSASLQWLQEEKTGIAPEMLAPHLQPYRVESIARSYEALF
ncbi:MAG: glycosyltransferase [Saprospiraceae bacterium]|nr:glycosyltransferase [Saprospiraceae bacterium]